MGAFEYFQQLQFTGKSEDEIRRLLVHYENKQAEKRAVTLLPQTDAQHPFLAFTSMPYAFGVGNASLQLAQLYMRKLWKGYNTTLYAPIGNVAADIMVVGDVPQIDYYSVQEGFLHRMYAESASTLYLRKALLLAGIQCRVWMTHLLKYPKEKNKGSDREEVDEQKHHLKRELDLIAPSVVFLVGEAAQQKFPFRMNVPCVELHHPAYAIRSLRPIEWYASIIENHVKELS